MINNTTKALLSAALVVLIVALAAFYIHQNAIATTTQVSSPATTTTSPPTTILFNYSSFSSITAQHTAAMQQQKDLSTTYVTETNYPSYAQQGSRVIYQEIIEYNRSGNNTSLGLTVYSPTSNSMHASSIQFFNISGKLYFCSLVHGIGVNSTNETCYNGGSAAPVFADLENRTYLANSSGMMLGVMSQLSFSGQAVENAASYMGYNASYFHANLSDRSNPEINGNISIYSSSKYGIPLYYALLLNDKEYNSTNNTIYIYLKMTRLSTNVSTASAIPPYLAKFINAASG